MARSQRSAKLETRTARLKLPLGSREFVTVSKGLALCYRRTDDGFGTWQARIWDGVRYHYRKLGVADDHQNANGVEVLNFLQAQDKAREDFEQVTKGEHRLRPSTVSEAAKQYLAWYRTHRKSARAVEHTVRAHILPTFGEQLIDELRAVEIRNWLDKLASKPARARTSALSRRQNYRPAPATQDEKRARRATANRILTVFKAILNRAFRDGLASSDIEWRRVSPFPKANEARIRFLSDAEAVRLVNASPPDLRKLVEAALLTGARFGELVALHVHDVNLRTSQVYISESKSGKPRHIPLNPEGAALFRELLAGKAGNALVFDKANGEPWGKNHHVRSLLASCEAAKVTPAISFHELRHTYASHLAQAGVDLLTISKLLGHSDTRITAKHYAHLADKTLAAAVTKLPSLGQSRNKKVKALR